MSDGARIGIDLIGLR